MTQITGPAAGRPRVIKTGTLVVVGLFAVLLIGWFAYRPYIPPVWLHDFASDIALRASAEPNAPAPEDMRQATPHGLADSPYICVGKIVDMPWDRIVAVTNPESLRTHPVLSQATWPDKNLDDLTAQLTRDQRYQLLVLIKDNTVIDAQLFYTFWAKLDGIARPEGFAREEAIFTAASQGGVYVVSAATDVPPDACK